MDEFNEAVIVLSKCRKTHKTYGIRSERLEKDHWIFTWAFPVKDTAAKREGYDKTSIRGNIVLSESYPGCPYCKTGNLVACDCGHLSCKYTSDGQFTCEWCGKSGKIGAYTGGGITVGMDL